MCIRRERERDVLGVHRMYRGGRSHGGMAFCNGLKRINWIDCDFPAGDCKQTITSRPLQVGDRKQTIERISSEVFFSRDQTASRLEII